MLDKIRELGRKLDDTIGAAFARIHCRPDSVPYRSFTDGAELTRRLAAKKEGDGTFSREILYPPWSDPAANGRHMLIREADDLELRIQRSVCLYKDNDGLRVSVVSASGDIRLVLEKCVLDTTMMRSIDDTLAKTIISRLKAWIKRIEEWISRQPEREPDTFTLPMTRLRPASHEIKHIKQF